MTSKIATLLTEAEQNEEVRLMYANPKCKKCWGRGKYTANIPFKTRAGVTVGWENYNCLCYCVVRKIKKEMKKDDTDG